ncbi:PP2C family serine/threonine-protein phosphatase [Pseudoalteromonas rubra]|uniref:PPM-type phosphatase domain-containing protein n=1 Tax=Pseudoalteromonas rubra TaxID=43658 RepID=A0A0U3HHD1_9GAMM|nr:PP2C family serine/threonine-protein phosphatase [Pseudoalteromonas rubra]ALU42389.1 hypothetical protein AT705_05155 [Pseudoalteromonas rubra]
MSTPTVVDQRYGILICGNVIGANHVSKNTPCQDACLTSVQYIKGQPYVLFTVADGHGSARYVRSDIGAHFAVQSACSVVSDWLVSVEQISRDNPGNWLSHLRHDFGPRFAHKLRQTWLDRVTEHLKEHPFKEDELALNSTPINAYGTTIALAVVFNGQVFVGAIGDSGVFAVLNNGEFFVLNDTEDNNLGLTTNSLSQSDAPQQWKFKIIALDEVKMMCAVTDGFSDSLADIQLTLNSITDRVIGKGTEWLSENLPGFLTHLTQEGVGDDVASIFYLPNQQAGD